MGSKAREIRALRREAAETWLRATATATRQADEHLDEVRRAHAAQCEQLGRDVEKWRRKALDLEAGARRVADQNRVLRERLEDLRDGSLVMDLEAAYETQQKRLARALRGCARYRARLAGRDRYITGLERQLDAATSLDSPGIALGEGWQARRPDKPAAGACPDCGGDMDTCTCGTPRAPIGRAGAR